MGEFLVLRTAADDEEDEVEDTGLRRCFPDKMRPENVV